MSFEVKV